MSKKKQTPHDFRDGAGPVPAARHRNPDGSPGGWVAATATVAPTAFVGENAAVFGNAVVRDAAQVRDDARVSGAAQVRDDARVCGNAEVCDTARVCGNAEVCNTAWVCGNAQVFESARVFGDARVSGDARVAGTASVAGTAAVSGHARVAGGEVRGNDLFHAVLPGGLAVTLTTTHLAVGCQCLPLKTWDETWRSQLNCNSYYKPKVRDIRAVIATAAKVLGLKWRPPRVS